MFDTLKKKIHKLLDAIAQQNKATYGTQRLDCCDLNKSNKNG